MDVRAIAIVVCLSLVGHAGRGGEPKEPDRPWGDPSGGFRSRIWVERHPECPDAPAVIRYEIQNVGGQPATIWLCGFWPNHRVDVVMLDGEEVELTPLGEERREAFAPLGGRDKSAPRVLAPDEVYSAFEPIDVGRLIVLPRRGFRATVVYQEGEMTPVASNALEVGLAGP